MMRLDKFLADMNVGTRSELKKAIRKGMVHVNGEPVKAPDIKVSESDDIRYMGNRIQYQSMVYYMLNKPAGVVSATEDKRDTTVIDLLKEYTSIPKGVFPVGRLDKDTEGLLLLTNDGALSHELLSPKKHVEKMYYAEIQGEVTLAHVAQFLEGVDIGEKNLTMPAKLNILTAGEVSTVEISICEGKFHQIKRMFEAVDMEVLYLKRMRMGMLQLDEHLELGEIRPLSKEEITSLC